MKKGFRLLLAAFMTLAMFVPAQAEVLTVYDETATNEYSPIYGYYYDTPGYIVQTILPEADLTAMQGTFISSMKFYVAGENGNLLNGGKLAVSLGSTTRTNFSNTDPVEVTPVAEITMTLGEPEVVVNFTDPFFYEGGNLVIETKVVEKGNYPHNFFLGKASNVANVLCKGVYTTSTDAFYPKTTFTYEQLDDYAAISAREMAYGKLVLGTDAVSKTITITNLGKNAFTPAISGVSAPFSVEAVGEVAPGETKNIVVTMTPNAVGEYEQTMTINCGAAGEFEVALTGEVRAEVTVADGTNTESHVPVYGMSYDGSDGVGQMIYPAEMLTGLVGKKINSLAFYHDQPSREMNGGNIQLSIKVVEETAFASATAITDMTVVANAAPVAGETELVFTFNEPFEYTGGNLAVEALVTEAGSYGYEKFYGVTADAASYGYYNDFGFEANVFNFLPKATFGYVAEDTPVEITSYTVVGPETIFGTNWDPNDEYNNMTFDAENGVYTWSKEDVTLYNGFEFKVVGNHDYAVYEWPVGPYNWVANLPEEDGEGIYDILITFNPEAADSVKITCTLTKVGEVDPIEHVYTVVGPEHVFGTEWNINDENNNMVLDAETGLYTWSKENVALTESFGFKVVGDHSWANEWPQGYDNNWIVNIDEAGNYDLFITFNAETGEINCIATKVEPQPEFIRGDVNGDKTVTIADVTALVNMLLRNDPMIPAADTNLDEKMTIGDVTALINYLLSKSW